MIPFPDKKYSVIYADPPWSYSGGGAARNVTKHYHTMKPEDIYSLPVQNIAADDCLLFLWATFPNLDIALETIRRRRVVSATVMFVGAGADGLTSFSVLRGRLGTTAWSSEQFTEHDIGKTVFLTKEAAEAALEGGGAWQQ